MNKILLEHYVKLTNFLGLVFGIDYEIALHDLSDRNKSLVAIANSHISGRTIGAPLTNVALQIIAEKSYETSDWRLNYRGLSSGNKILRSSTFFIKDENKKLVGLLCINFDDSRYQELSDRVLKLCHPDAFVESNFQFDESIIVGRNAAKEGETFFDTSGATSTDAINGVLNKLNLTVGHLTHKDRQTIVNELYEQGVFMLKSAVKDIATSLNCSQASVYRYLTNAQKASSDR